MQQTYLATRASFVRVFATQTNATNNMLGSFLAKESDITGMTPTQIEIQNFLSLPYTPNKILDVIVIPDFPLRTGKAGSHPSLGVFGGGIQFEMLDFLDINNFGIPRDL